MDFYFKSINVFPAHAGVILPIDWDVALPNGVPRTRGGDPDVKYCEDFLTPEWAAELPKLAQYEYLYYTDGKTVKCPPISAVSGISTGKLVTPVDSDWA